MKNERECYGIENGDGGVDGVECGKESSKERHGEGEYFVAWR